MRIMFVTDTFLPEINGVSISLSRQINMLAKKHEILVVCPQHPDEMKTSFAKNVEVYRLGSVSLPTYKEIRLCWPRKKLVERLISRFNPDIIHVQTPGTLGFRFARFTTSTPKLITFHTLLTEQLDYISISRLFGRERKEGFLDLWVWKYLIWLHNCFDHVITPTQTIKELLIEKGINVPIGVVSNGLIDFNAKQNYTKTKSIVHCGRISYEKKIDVIIKAIAVVKKHIPEIQLHIIGDGPARNSLERLCKELGVDDCVRFVGWIDNSQLASYLERYDFFVTASTMETQGVALLEAMACGLPIVGVNKYAIAEYVSEKNGYLAEPDDVADVAKGIRFLLKNRHLRSLGAESRKIAHEHKLSRTIEKFELLYSTLIKKKQEDKD